MRSFLSVFAILLFAASSQPWGADALPDYPAEQLSERVWVIHGPTELPNPQNKGFMNNPAFVITSTGVVVIDPGSTLESGRMVLRQIARVTDKPVTHVFASHIHGDHWLGNHAIREKYPEALLYAHPNMIAQAHDGEAEAWLKLMDQLTEGASKGTQAIIPDQPLKDAQQIKVGDRTLRIYLSDWAHTKTDAMVEVVEESLLVTGDNVLYKRIARMDDASFRGNPEELTTIRYLGNLLVGAGMIWATGVSLLTPVYVVLFFAQYHAIVAWEDERGGDADIYVAAQNALYLLCTAFVFDKFEFNAGLILYGGHDHLLGNGIKRNRKLFLFCQRNHAVDIVKRGIRFCYQGDFSLGNGTDVIKGIDFKRQLVASFGQIYKYGHIHSQSKCRSIGFCIHEPRQHCDTSATGFVLHHNVPASFFFDLGCDNSSQRVSGPSGAKSDLKFNRSFGRPIFG